MDTEKKRPLVVIGGGQHASVLIEAARSSGWDVLGVVDGRGETPLCARLGVKWLGDDALGLSLAARRDAFFVIGIGGPPASRLRADIAARFDAAGALWGTVVHERAWVSPTATLREGSVVFAGAIVNTGATVGRHAIVNTSAVIEHDVSLGDFVQVTPGVVIGGGAALGESTYLGLGCRVRDHVRVGERVTVGMGAVVVGDVADDAVVVGVPARPRAARAR